MAHSQAIHQTTTDIYFVRAQGKETQLLILKEHWSLSKEHLDQKPWGENKNCGVRDSGGCRCGSPFSFPSVNRRVVPRICVSSVVLFTHWSLARVKWLQATFREMQTSPHSVSSKAELVLPFISLRPAGAARLSHPDHFSPMEPKILSFILPIRLGHILTLR